MTEETVWKPEYQRWRHGGYYVTNAQYPSGAVGCVSNNYPDKQWRIVYGPQDVTFPSRNTAARAEYAITLVLKQLPTQTEECDDD